MRRGFDRHGQGGGILLGRLDYTHTSKRVIKYDGSEVKELRILCLVRTSDPYHPNDP